MKIASIILLSMTLGSLLTTAMFKPPRVVYLKPTKACVVAHLHLNPETSTDICGKVSDREPI